MLGKIELCPVKRFSWSVSSSGRLICSCLCLYGHGGSKNETQCQERGGTRQQGHPKKSNYVSTGQTNQIRFGFRVGKLLFLTKIYIYIICCGRHKLDRIGSSMLLN